MSTKFKIGDKVKVMNKTPNLKPFVEGTATCLKFVKLESFSDLETWIVRFEDGSEAIRRIAIENKVS